MIKTIGLHKDQKTKVKILVYLNTNPDRIVKNKNTTNEKNNPNYC